MRWTWKRREKPVFGYTPQYSQPLTLPDGEPTMVYRYWNMIDDGLTPPIYSGVTWAPGVYERTCEYGCTHWREDCSCGLYGFRDLNNDVRCDRTYFDAAIGYAREVSGIVGAVWLFNAFSCHDERVRGQFAVIGALTYPETATEEWKQQALKIAQSYDVPLVTAATLPSAAREHLQQLTTTHELSGVGV